MNILVSAQRGAWALAHGPREAMEYDVVVVGADRAGLAMASVVVLEKSSEPGAHVLSGAVMDPRALTELFPGWQERGAPLHQPVTHDDVLMLSATGAWRTTASPSASSSGSTTATHG